MKCKKCKYFGVECSVPADQDIMGCKDFSAKKIQKIEKRVAFGKGGCQGRSHMIKVNGIWIQE